MNKDQVMGNVDNSVFKIHPDAGTQVGSTKQQTIGLTPQIAVATQKNLSDERRTRLFRQPVWWEHWA